MYFFCTYFDIRYLSRGLALYQSLRRYCPSFRIWILCTDSETYEALAKLKLPEIQPIALNEFERGDEALLHAKQNRSLLEYYFTCTPSLPLFILGNYPQVNLITYLDADLFFYSDPSPLFGEMGVHSVAIMGHRFSERLQHLHALGIYNVGWLSFRRDEHARQCLLWWRERCNEWCCDQADGGRFADQKYLDDWPTRFTGVTVLLHKGANLAPWNLANYQLKLKAKQLWVEDQPLIFFHFHSLRRVTERLFDSNLAHYRVALSPLVRREIYNRYLQMLQEIEQRDLCDLTKLKRPESLVRHAKTARPSHPLLGSLLYRVGGLGNVVKGLMARQYLLAPKISCTHSNSTKRIDPHLPGQSPLLPSPPLPRTEGGRRTRGLPPQRVEHKPLISIVTVVLDGERYLEQAIQSVVSQSYQSIEYIVVDGGSRDGTINVIKRYEARIDYWVSEPDKGIYDAMNKGWAVSTGDYVYYLGADDVLLSLPISALTRAHTQGLDIVFGDVRLSNGRQFKSCYGLQLLLSNTLHHQGLFLRRKMFDTSPFREEYRVFSDFDLNQRLYKQGKRALPAQETIAMFRLTRPRCQSSPAEFFRIVRVNFGVVVMGVSYLFLKLRGFAFWLQGWDR
jgi:hypothetical protein